MVVREGCTVGDKNLYTMTVDWRRGDRLHSTPNLSLAMSQLMERHNNTQSGVTFSSTEVAPDWRRLR